MMRCITNQQDHIFPRQMTWEAASSQRLRAAWARSLQAVVSQKGHWLRCYRRQRPRRIPKLDCHTIESQCSTKTKVATPVAELPSIASSPTLFQFDIVVHVNHRHQPCASRRVMRRVILDTGANMNMVSAAALRGIELPVGGEPCEIRSIAGSSRIIGQTDLRFHFLKDVETGGIESAFEEEFNLLDDNEQPLFDFILGQEWIARHFLKFFDLTSSKASVQELY